MKCFTQSATFPRIQKNSSQELRISSVVAKWLNGLDVPRRGELDRSQSIKSIKWFDKTSGNNHRSLKLVAGAGTTKSARMDHRIKKVGLSDGGRSTQVASQII